MNALIDLVVDRLHVSTSYLDVAREFRRRMSGASVTRAQRRAVYQRALARHASNRRLYRFVMRGAR